jgi:hypothetical protein
MRLDSAEDPLTPMACGPYQSSHDAIESTTVIRSIAEPLGVKIVPLLAYPVDPAVSIVEARPIMHSCVHVASHSRVPM